MSQTCSGLPASSIAGWLSMRKINCNQVTLLTQETEDSFSVKKKAGAVT